jgi:hypothetical protein
MPLFMLGPAFGFRYGLVPPCGIWAFGCSTLPVYGPVFMYGEASNQRPQLVMKDGMIYSVTDYWVVSDQLHFRTLEDGGTKSAVHVIDFNQLDVQKTTDLDAQRGFRFVLRNEPMDQYLWDHRELVGPNPATSPPGSSTAQPPPR